MRRSDREISSIRDVEDIINNSDVCRIAFADNNSPYIVTMNFGYVISPNKLLYFHCANEGKKLEMIRRNNYVCFEMDIDHLILKGERSCDWGMKFRSVVGFGKIQIVEELTEKILGMNSIMAHYGGTAPFNFDENIFNRTTILRLEIAEMSGKMK